MFVQHIGTETSLVVRAREVEIRWLKKKSERLVRHGHVLQAKQVMRTISYLQALNESGRGPAKCPVAVKDRVSHATTLWA